MAIELKDQSHDDARSAEGAVVIERIKPWKHVVIWLVGVVVASLTPFIWIYASSSPRSGSPSIYQVLDTGDLFLIAIIVLIAGVTEIVLLLQRIRQNLTIGLLIVGGFLFVLFDAAKYAGASLASINTIIAPHSVTYWSLGAFVVSALHSSICVGLAAGAR